MTSRRRFLQQAVAASVLAPSGFVRGVAQESASTVNDVSGLNPILVASEHRPRSTDEVRALLRGTSGVISLGGGRFSMGGQIAAPGSTHLDLRGLNQVVAFDPSRRVIRVQAGVTWRDLQELIDPRDLSVRIMQSFSNFTVGGSVSVNCHGRYVGAGPLVNSVRALQLVTPSGDVLELSRTREPELFGAVFGGYGAFGVVTEVELELAANARIERGVEDVPLEGYAEYFQRRVLGDTSVVLHNADLAPPGFDRPRAVTWRVTDKPVTAPLRLTPRGLDYDLQQNALWAISELPGGAWIREDVVMRSALREPAVVWRNHEASLDTASLEPRTRRWSTYLLQEYFIPVQGFLAFAHDMARILRAHDVNALNVSLRHSPSDTVSLLRWAPEEVFCFVLYYKQRSSTRASRASGMWTRKLIDAALTQRGRYYLPYRLDATQSQFERAYPEASRFAELKSQIDPQGRLRNSLWDRYLPA